MTDWRDKLLLENGRNGPVVVFNWWKLKKDHYGKHEAKAKQKSRQVFVYETMTFIFFP